MKHTLKSAVVGAALGLGLCASGAPQAATATAVVTGTVHDALFAVSFDGNNGLAAGAPGTLLETTDGGQKWAPAKNVPTKLALLGVALKGEHAIAVGQQGLILTRSGGEWKKVESGSTERLLSVAINSKGAAVAVGAFGTVLSSSDGGATWAAIKPVWEQYAEAGTEPHMYAAAIDENGTITVAGEFSLIMRRAAGSGEWKSLNKDDASLFALFMGSNGIGYAVGQNGTVLRSANNGDSWTKVDAGTGAILLGVHSSNDGKVVVTGMREMRYSSDNGSTWTGVTGGGVNTLWYQGIGQPEGSTAALAVGQAGRILRIEN
ncbi:WD40/YVTN/BNR-like repeat-containing protein [Nevskia ramosa]|uniref:WD40/YVTN/BNR-like repeat-containing protein n=1 Tax=Nevskia ramosa TaxID=64002 RepID=UPI003D0A4264